MKKSALRKTIVPLLGAVLSLTLASCNNNSESSEEIEYDENGIATDEYGPQLLIHIHQLMLKTHTRYVKYAAFNSFETNGTIVPYGETEAVTRVSIDQSGEDSTKNEQFYSGLLTGKTSAESREHVWACANSSKLWVHDKTYQTSDPTKYSLNYVDRSYYYGGGSDLYHIRPCTSIINTAHGNGKFYEFKDSDVLGTNYYEYSDGGPYISLGDKPASPGFANKFEPADEMKGDVARILMYVYVHYSALGDNSAYDNVAIVNNTGLVKNENGDGIIDENDHTDDSEITEDTYTVSKMLGNLNLANVFNSSYSVSEVQALLVKWNKLDPVSETEKLRNNTVELVQGNRNPFVDHPDYMARCFSIEEE